MVAATLRLPAIVAWMCMSSLLASAQVEIRFMNESAVVSKWATIRLFLNDSVSLNCSFSSNGSSSGDLIWTQKIGNSSQSVDENENGSSTPLVTPGVTQLTATKTQRLIVQRFHSGLDGTYTCFTNDSGVLRNASVILRLNVENCSVCHSNASCSITATGRANCTCNDYFVGDGRMCQDADECALGTDNCDAYARCVNEKPLFRCECVSPYTGNGTHCNGGLLPEILIPSQAERYTFFKGTTTDKLVCNVDSNLKPTSIVWEKDGVLLEERSFVFVFGGYEAKYDILSAAVNDSGTYVCVVTTNYSSNEPNLTTRSFPIEIFIEDPARIVINPSSAVVLQGGNVSLTCFGSGSPSPTLSWSFNGLSIADLLMQQQQSNVSVNATNNRPVKPLPFTLHQNGSQLRLEIMTITFEFSGQYTCTGRNNITSNRTLGLVTVRENATVEVEVPAAVAVHPVSTSLLLGGSLDLQCIASGYPDPIISWLINGIVFDFTQENVNISSVNTTTSTLTITNGSKSDEGNYSCQVYNNLTTSKPTVQNSKPAQIKLEVPASILSSPPENVTVLLEKSILLSCGASGIPLPTVTWIHYNGTLISTGPTITLVQQPGQANLTFINVTMAVAGIYACVASNKVGAVHGRQVQMAIILTVKDPYARLSCSPYPPSGGICSSFIGGVSIFYNSSISSFAGSSFAGSEGLMRGFFQIFQFLKPTDSCFDFAFPMVCRYIFSPCKIGRKIPEPRQICKNDCLTGQKLCPIVWARLTVEYLGLIDTGHLGSPGCRTLTYYNGGDDKECIGITDEFDPRDRENTLQTDSCIHGKGRGYNGTVNVTKSGHACQAWESQLPNPHSLLPKSYVEIRNASNYCRNPGGRGPDGPWCYTTNRSVRWEYCDIPKCNPKRRCEEYKGVWCRNYIRNGSKIFVDDDFGSQSSLEKSVEPFFKTVLPVSQMCKESFFALVCGLAFPPCDVATDIVRPRKMCNEYCEYVKTNACPSLWGDLAGLSTLLANIDPLKAPPNCSALPKMNGGASPSCSIGMPGFNLPNTGQERTDCYTDDGQTYRGNISVTQSGFQCQSWLAHYPHNHTMDIEYNFTRVGILSRGHFCRNPNGRGERPWCYTTDHTIRWEYCDIPKCAPTTSAPPPERTTSAQPTTSAPTVAPTPTEGSGGLSGTLVGVIAGVGAAVVVLVIILLLIVCGVVAKNKRDKMDIDNSIVMTNRSSRHRSGSRIHSNPNYEAVPIKENLVKMEFPVENIEFLEPLGEGYFGKVFKGRAVGILKEDSTLVAVKTLKDGASDQSKRDFEHESCLLSEFDHDNIVRLLGVSMLGEPQCMIFEFMQHGDLNKYLHTRSPDELAFNVKTAIADGTTPPDDLAVHDLVYISKQVASGMSYLSQRHYVHRDLATRNCLVGSDMIVKIADFGMSQDIYSTDYYRVGEHAMLPVRWMPPEAIIYGKFTVESDVWSYGIVMWEIFTFAMQPYFGLSNEEVVDRVRRGVILEKPEDCPVEIYSTMKRCWVKEPFNRPSFELIEDYHHKWLSGSRGPISPGPLMTSVAAVPNPYQNMKKIRDFATENGEGNKNGAPANLNYDRPGPTRSAYDNSGEEELPPPPDDDDLDSLPPPSPLSEGQSTFPGNGFLDKGPSPEIHPDYPNYARPSSDRYSAPLVQQDRSETIV